MTMTDSFVVVVVREVSEPQCDWAEHSDPSKGFRHDGGPARFDLMMPCGYQAKACARFVEWLSADSNYISCATVDGERHDVSSIVWFPL